MAASITPRSRVMATKKDSSLIVLLVKEAIKLPTVAFFFDDAVGL